MCKASVFVWFIHWCKIPSTIFKLFLSIMFINNKPDFDINGLVSCSVWYLLLWIIRYLLTQAVMVTSCISPLGACELCHISCEFKVRGVATFTKSKLLTFNWKTFKYSLRHSKMPFSNAFYIIDPKYEIVPLNCGQTAYTVKVKKKKSTFWCRNCNIFGEK